MPRARLVRSASAAALSIALLVPVGGAARAVAPADEPSTASRETRTRVLAISIDGLNPRAIRELGRSGAPAFHRLRRHGAGTLNARTAYEQTATLPNHTTMVTGRRIDARRGGHGVTWNHTRPQVTVHEAAGRRVSSVFSRVHRAGGSTALFAAKRKLELFDRSWPKGVDRFRIDEDNVALVRAARTDLVERARAFTFLHVSLPDVSGHASGFMSPAYLDAVRRTDRLVGTLLQAVDRHRRLSRSVVVVLTADHGGGPGRSHSDPGRLANHRVPFLVWGRGVRSDNLYDLNPDYRAPGRSRPTYAGRQPVRNGDLANLAADLLGLRPVRGSELNVRQNLDVR